jgi:O-antigen ligase
VPISKAGTNIFEVLVFFFWILEGNWKEKYQLLKHNLLSVTILLLISISIFSLPYASDLKFGLNYIGKYRHFLIILVFYTSLKKEYIKYIFVAFLSSMFISEIVSYGIFLQFWHFKNISSGLSLFMNYSNYSVFLSYTSMILLYAIFDKDIDFKYKIFSAIFFILTTFNLFINRGRTGYVIYIILLLLMIILQIKNKIKALMVFSVMLMTILFLSYNFSTVFKTRMAYTFDDFEKIVNQKECTESFGTRVILWMSGYEKFKDNLPLGAGIGNDMKNINYYASKTKCKHFRFTDGVGDHHNAFLTLSIQYGIGGVIVMVLLFYSLIKLKFKTKKYQVLNYLFIILFFFWSFVGISFHTMTPMIFFSLFSGLYNAISKLEVSS